MRQRLAVLVILLYAGCVRPGATAFAALEYLWQGKVAFQQWRGGARSSGFF